MFLILWWSYKIHHIPDGPPQPCQADWDMTGLLEGNNENTHTLTQTVARHWDRNCKLALQTHIHHTAAAVYISRRGLQRGFSLWLGARLKIFSPKAMQEQRGCHCMPLFSYKLQICHTHSQTCSWPSSVYGAGVRVCVRSWVCVGPVGWEEIPLLFPRKQDGTSGRMKMWPTNQKEKVMRIDHRFRKKTR